MEERLQKLLARAGLGSRRACEAYLAEGRVRVNGIRAELGQKADPKRDTITVDGEPISLPDEFTYVILNKPRGVVSSAVAQDNRPTVVDLVGAEERLYPVGRLDADSEGLILLTNDGELTDYLTHPRYESEKEYRVLVKGEPDEERLRIWRRGVVIDGKRTAPAQVRREERAPRGTWLRVVMHEGRKHQIRDIGEALGMPVMRLVRVRMGPLHLGSLAPGHWRELNEDEVGQLRRKTERASLAAKQPRATERKAARKSGGPPAAKSGRRPTGSRPPSPGSRRPPRRPRR
jgi:23S rRNA pseudouridine2605 synthase